MEERYGPDSVWAVGRQSIFPDGAFAAAPAELAACLTLAGVQGPVDVLDLPCGPGRHSVPMARIGHRVTAVDITPSYLDEVRSRIEEGFSLDVVQADMREFVRPAAFDLILNLYHSFGYFDDPEDDRRVLRNMAASLRPGGVLVMDLMAQEVLARDLEPVNERLLEDGTLVREESLLSDDGSWLHSTWLYLRVDVRHTFDMSHRLYSGEGITRELRGAGFSEVRLLGGLDGRPWNADAVRLVVVARRGPEGAAGA